MTQAQSSTPVGGLIVGDAPVKLWGLTSRERIERQFRRLGVTPAPAAGGDVIVLHAGWVFDEPLVAALRDAASGTLLCDEASGTPVAAKVAATAAATVASALAAGQAPAVALERRTPATLANVYNNKLRKREVPYLLPLSAATLDAIERRMFLGSYKGVTDVVTKYVWPTPARHATRLCAALRIAPNTVTTVGLLAVIAAFYAFWHGHYALGLVAAWLMTFLDTVDGKLARVTLVSSRFGDIYDHGIDLIHPPFWYWAWVHGLVAVGLPLEYTAPILWIVIGGYVAQRVEEGLFTALFGLDMHIWRPFDSFFRLITARRNPNLLLLTVAVLAGRPDLGMVAVAAWTLVGFLVHGVQIVQALGARRRGPITSWLSR